MIYLKRIYIRLLRVLIDILFLIENIINVIFSILEVFIPFIRNEKDSKVILVDFRNKVYFKLLDLLTWLNQKELHYENEKISNIIDI